jgi:iron complex outermembrane recepter protein
MRQGYCFKVGVSFMAFAAGITAPAAAQESAPVQTASNENKLEDILVIAQRRSENLQTVPLAIQAVTATSLERSGVTNLDQLTKATTGLTLLPQVGQAQAYIRGVGTFTTGTGEEGSVATYVDGVYYGQLSSNVFALNNVERVEVLKGPQGTLFGRNATGGLIQIITRDPSHTPSASVTGGYSSYQTVTGSLYATAGLSDALATDIALYYDRQHKGWGNNTFLPGNPDVHRRKNFAARTKTKWDAGEAFSLTLAADYVYSQAPGTASMNGRPGSRLFDGQGQVGSVYDSRENFKENAWNKQYGFSARAEYDLGGVTLTSTTAYRHYRSFVAFDQDHTAARLADIDLSDKTKTFQQEFLLLGSVGALDITAGLFGYDANAGKDGTLVVRSIVPSSNTSVSTRVYTRSYAAFSQVSYHLTDQLTAILGLRYTSEKRRLDANVVGIAPNPLAGVTLVDSANFPKSQTNRKFNKLTWRGALQYQINPDAMIYASASRGFKSGVFNSSSPSAPATSPETLDAYAVGLKTDWLDGRLRFNAEGFYYNYRDIQLTVVQVGGFRLFNAAKGTIKGADVDLSYAPPIDSGDLVFRASASYANAEYKLFTGAPCYTANPAPATGNTTSSCNASGNNMALAPKLTTNASVDYIIPISTFDAGINLSWYHNGGYYFEPQNRLKQPSYDVVNVQFSLQPESKGWEARLFARNIFDKRYYVSMSNNSLGDYRLPAEPRTYGVSLTFRIGG